MNEVCQEVEIEPHLQSLQGESFYHLATATKDEARLDIKANVLWDTRFSKTFFNVKIFNPLAKSYPKSIHDAYTSYGFQRRLECERSIIPFKNENFNPLVFAHTGGAVPTAFSSMKRLAAKICKRKEASYADAIAYIRTKLCFVVPKLNPLHKRLQVNENMF